MATRPDIKPLGDDVLHWNMMIYADPGAGKTVLAGSDIKVLFIAPEKDGLMSAQTLGSKASRILVPDWETMINTYEWFDEHPEELKEYDVISIDSVSEMQHLAKDYVLRMNRGYKISKNQDPDKMQIQDYGEMHTLLEDMVRGFNDLPVNVLYTATSKMVEDADGNNFLVPDLQGKKEYGIAMKIASLMTIYGYLRTEVHQVPETVEEGEEPKFKSVKRRVVYFEDTGTIRGKDRSNKLKPFVMNPTLQQIRLAIKGQRVRNAEGFIVKPSATAAKAVPAKATPPKVTQESAEKPAEKVEPAAPEPVKSEAEQRLDRNPETKAKIEEAEKEIEKGNDKELALETAEA